MSLGQYLSKIRILFQNRQSRSRGILLLTLIFLIILIIPALIYERSSKSSLDLQRAKLRDLMILSSDYKMLKEKVSFAEKKSSTPQVGGIANVVNDIAASLGIKGKIKAIKSVSSRQLKRNISEEAAEVSIEKITTNELINLLHKIDTMPVVLTIKKTTMKKSFEKPELLDMTISLAMFNIQPEAKQ